MPLPPVIWFNDRKIVDRVDITPRGYKGFGIGEGIGGGYPTSHDNCWTANREKLTEHNFIATTITKSHA